MYGVGSALVGARMLRKGSSKGSSKGRVGRRGVGSKVKKKGAKQRCVVSKLMSDAPAATEDVVELVELEAATQPSLEAAASSV